MAASDHLAFIIAAYAAAVAVVGGLAAWVMLDHRTQLRRLAELDGRGLGRRASSPPPPPPSPPPAALQRAKEKA